uniref:Retroviral polymerase SH3-like domain-containing protein n=1 Tax=Brassica oleracea TaxID=3712 RepID=A0A3P6FBL1_BRAOL|nr:unnamed protein product [Brassica oleracea]
MWSGRVLMFILMMLQEVNLTRSKLDSKSKKCYFIGYGNAEFGYRFWDDENRKINRSKNVVFNEEALYKDKLREGSEKKKSTELLT